MENRIHLTPIKAIDEVQLNKLIDLVTDIAKCDLNIINQIRDIFFQISNPDFDRLILKYSNRFLTIIATLFKLPNTKNNETEQRIASFKSAFLSLMTFLNFKMLTSRTTKEFLELLSKQICESSLEDLSQILRLISISFNTRDQEFVKTLPKVLIEINTPIKNRLFEIINNLDQINMNKLTPAISLLSMLSSSSNLLLSILPSLDKILKYDYPNRIPLQNLASLFALQFKIVTMIPPINANSPVVPTIVRILLKTPPSISSIIDNSADILINYIQKDPERRIEPMIPYFPRLLNFKLFTSENFRSYMFIIQYLFEQLQKMQKINDDFLLRFVKYITSVLHFRKSTFTICSTCFSNIYSIINIPTAQNQFRNTLLSLFIFTFDVGFMEIEQQIVRMMDMMNSQKELLIVFNALLIVGEYYSRILKFLTHAVKIVNQCDILKGKPFLAQVVSPLPKIEYNQLVELLVRSLIILMTYREALQSSIQMVRFTEPSNNSQDHYKLCNQNLKAVRTYDRARKFHFSSAQEMINCISSLPPFFALNVWDSFFEKFFSSNNSFGLDTCTFRVVTSDSRVFPYFFISVTGFICRKLKSGDHLTSFLKPMQTIFEKLSMKPSSPPKTIDTIDKIYNEANKVISTCKEILSDPQYCSEILSFIRHFSSFINFVSNNNNKYTTQLINDSFISFIIKNASQVPFAQKAILNFIAFCACLKQEILKNQNVINFLILSLSSDFNQSLFLLHASKKQDKVNFFKHQLMPKMFVSLIQLLDKATNENRKIIIKFLRKIPSNQIKNMASVSDSLLNNHSIVIRKGDKSLVFDCDSLIASIRNALTENINNAFLWNFLNEIIKSFANIKIWNPDQHKFFFQILILFLHFHQKNPKIVETQFKQIFKIENLILQSHFLIAFCIESIEPTPELIGNIFHNINDKESFKLFISNIITIIGIMEYSTKIALPKICNCIINYVSHDVIDEISFSILVHQTVIDSYSLEWITEQHCDSSTVFLELNYLSDENLKLIQFCKDLLTGKSVSISPILNLIKLSTSLLPILVAVEMISKNENIEEIFQFLDEFLENKIACFEYGDSRIIGPLSRAFPIILDKYYDKIVTIIKESTETVSSMNNRKHQGLFLVILLPVLNSNKFSNIIDFDEIFKVCIQFLTLPSPLLKCQAQQVYHAIFKYGPDSVKLKIQQNFEQITKINNSKNNFLKWTPLINISFTYFPIFPNKVLSISLNDLDLIKQGIALSGHQLTSTEEFFKTIMSNLSFLSSGMVVKYLISENLFIPTGRKLIGIINQLTYFPKNTYLLKFFEKSENEFPKFINQSLNDYQIMNFFASHINEPKIKDLFNKYQSSIQITNEIILNHPIIVLILLKTNFCNSFIQSIISVAHQMIEAYDKKCISFNPVILKEIVVWFANNRIEDFLQMSFHAFEVNSPMLTALFSQSSQNELNLDYFLNMKYPENDEIIFSFLEVFLFPFLQSHNELIDKTVNFIHDKFSIYVFLHFINLLYSTRVLTSKVPYDAYEIYQKCDTDELQLQAILFWGYSGSSHFIEMFTIFTSFFNINLATEIRNVADDLKVPPEFYDNEQLCTVFFNLVRTFSKNPNILITVLNIYIKNRDAFHSIDNKIWEYIQEQAMRLSNPRKNLIQNYKMPFHLLIKILPTNGKLTENENALARRITKFANYMMTFSKEEEKNKYDILLKYRGFFMKSLLNLGKIVGSQCEFANLFFSIAMELYPRINQPNPQTNEITLFELLMNSLPELVETMAQEEDNPILYKFIDFILENEKLVDTIWTSTFLCLSYLSDSIFYKNKVNETSQRINITDEFINHAFPILWSNPPNDAFRISSLVKNAINFCTSYNPEKPVDMLLNDCMLSNIFENPYDSSLHQIFSACKECIKSNHVHGNCVFFTRVFTRGLSIHKTDNSLAKMIFSNIIKMLEDPNVQPFFASKPEVITEKVFKALSPKTKINFSPYFIDSYGQELTEFLEKTDFNYIRQFSQNKITPISIYLSSFFEFDKLTDIIKLVMNLSSAELHSLEKQIDKPFKSTSSLQIQIKLGIDSINYPSFNSSDTLSSWDFSKLSTNSMTTSSIYESLGLPNLAQKDLLSSINQMNISEIKEVINEDSLLKNKDPRLEDFFSFLSSEGHTIKHYIELYSPILNKESYFINANSFPLLMIIYQGKYLITALKQSNNKQNGKVEIETKNLSSKLFSYMLSPSFDPKLHETYSECRKMMLEFLNKNSHNHNNDNRYAKLYDSYEKRHIKNYQKSKDYHFVQHYKNNIQSLIISADFQKVLASKHEANGTDEKTEFDIVKENVIKGLRFNKNSDVFLAAAYYLFNEIKDDFLNLYNDKSRIPFRWSQLFCQIGCPELSNCVHTAFKCYFINSNQLITDATVRNILAFLESLRDAIRLPQLQLLKERYEKEMTLSSRIQQENISSGKRILFNESNFKLSNDESNNEESNESLPQEFIDKCQNLCSEKGENDSIFVCSFPLNPILALLYDSEDNLIVSASLYFEGTKGFKCSLRSLLSSGFAINYSLIPFNPMESRLGTFYSIVSKIFHRSPSSYSRSQSLESIPSLPISDGFYLMQSSSEPFVESSQMKNLLEIYLESHSIRSIEDQKLENEPNSTFNYASKKEFASWFFHFSTRFALLSILQLLNDTAVFNPYNLMFDKKNAAITLTSMDLIKENNLALFRFCGKIKKLLDNQMINGPFELGFISAANCFSFNRAKLCFFIKTVLKDNVSDLEKLLKFSAIDNHVDDARTELNSLIKSSFDNNNLLFSIPWI